MVVVVCVALDNWICCPRKAEEEVGVEVGEGVGVGVGMGMGMAIERKVQERVGLVVALSKY